MNKTKIHIISVLILVFFVAVMLSGEFLKKPFGKTDDVMGYIESLKKDVTEENWKQAEIDLSSLKKAWETVEKRVQYSVERDEMIMISTSIARLEGALSAKDKSFMIIELSEIKEHWNELEE